MESKMTDEWDFYESQFACPICGSDKVVSAIGNKSSKVLIVGEFPGEEELKHGKPMVGPMGIALRQELAFLGFDIKSARRTNLWLHPPNKNKLCLQHGIEEVIKEAQGKTAILLFGDDVCKIFMDKSVTKIAGLLMKSNYFSAPIVVVSPNPAMMFHQGKGVGEIRLALKKFVRYLEEYDDSNSNSNTVFHNSNPLLDNLNS